MFATTSLDSFANDWPTRPITAVIGYKPGGGTDFVSRSISPLLEDHLHTSIKLVNQPGAAAAIATDFIWNKPSNGYWWLMSSGFNRGLRVTGQHATVPYSDWQFYMADTTIMSFSVRADSPITDFDDFLERCRSNLRALTVSNSGIGGSWHLGGTLVKKVAKVDFVDVPYKGGKPALLACLNGEVDVVSGGIHEHLGSIKSGSLRNLCVCATSDLSVSGITLKTINHFVPGLQTHTPFGGGSTMAIKRDTDPLILKQIANAWMQAATSLKFVELETAKVRFVNPLVGAEADKKAALWECIAANLLHEAGKSKYDPQVLGIPPISEFENFWPPKHYRPAI
ncbi:MAG: hypothetical protein DHS20C01_32920 [marine bacterium B5-7]|nr:MAG: hypothetical protein DHS20C01_32920 [marine bacterium B5-7]